MPRHPRTQDEAAVFLNVPFDAGYEPLFVALIAALVAIGRKPRCVLELPDHGQGRLERIVQHMAACRVSIHDLSRVGSPVRFNMPFELGLAFALRTYHPSGRKHSFVLLERTPHRLDRTLSDIRGRDVYIHEGKPRGVISAVLDSLGPGPNHPSPGDVYVLWRRLMKDSRVLKKEHSSKTLFGGTLFKGLVAAAGLRAVDQGLISG
jgi:hypothetical protein